MSETFYTTDMRVAVVRFPDKSLEFGVTLGGDYESFVNGLAHLKEVVTRSEYPEHLVQPENPA